MAASATVMLFLLVRLSLVPLSDLVRFIPDQRAVCAMDLEVASQVSSMMRFTRLKPCSVPAKHL